MLNVFMRWAKTAAGLLLLGFPTMLTADTEHPLKPLDFSSPRATLNTFLNTGDRALSFLRDQHWDAPTRESTERLKAFLADIESALDLSKTPPAARWDLGRDSVFYHYAVLSRIELPSQAQIPAEAPVEVPKITSPEQSEVKGGRAPPAGARAGSASRSRAAAPKRSVPSWLIGAKATQPVRSSRSRRRRAHGAGPGGPRGARSPRACGGASSGGWRPPRGAGPCSRGARGRERRSRRPSGGTRPRIATQPRL